jgi:mono/diheme cytochrome c family protein
MFSLSGKSWACIALVGFAFGCKKEEPAPAPAPPQPAQVAAPVQAAPPNHAAAARTIFKSRCAVCHGDSGHGDGPGAAALTPKPRNYSDDAWQKSVTDEQISNTILLGGAAVGKSPIMPANPDLKEKPEVLAELVKLVRGFANK